MCGICGFVSKKGEVPDKDLIRLMLDRLYHRGPDGRGWFRDKIATLGHTRLSIIDLSGGTQPLSNEDGSIWISFNGEIYNYIELREELLALGHVFKSNSDTEVIIHAWESWREECFSRFNGQWAVSLWDRKRKELILSRDRHGIRPLYYTDTDRRFLFSSEIKAIFADKNVIRSFSKKGLQETFTFWGPVAPMTVFDGILEIPPGYYAVYKNNQLNIKPYWSVNFPEDNKDKLKPYLIKEKAFELKEKLINASRLRFERSDVPVGAYLSGGIDSSICASIVNKYAREGLKTFSIRFSDSQFDEGYYQSEMVKRLGTDHKSFIVNPQDIGAVFPQVVLHAERPILRTAPAPMYLLSKLVRDSGYKVVVTGEGADEVLGGYDIFREAYVRRQIAKEGHTPETESLLGLLYPWMGDSFKKTPAFTRSFFSKNLQIGDPALSHRPRWDNFKLMRPLFSSEMFSLTKENDVAKALLSKIPLGNEKWSPLAKAQWLEYTTLLSGYILSAQGDRMLMANSIEGRFPFLDVELDKFANGLNSELKLCTKELTEKFLLKEAFKNDLPSEITNRSKQPYQSPNGISFFNNKNENSYTLDWVDSVLDAKLIERTGIFNHKSIEILKEKCKKASNKSLSHGDNTRIVTVLSTMLVFRDFIENNDFSMTIPKKWKENEYIVDCV